MASAPCHVVPQVSPVFMPVLAILPELPTSFPEFPLDLAECLADLVRSVPGSLLIDGPAGDLVDHAEGLCGPRGCRGDLPECLDGRDAGRGGLSAPLLPLHRRSAQRQAVVLPRG